MDSNLYLQNNENLLPRDQVRITGVTASLYPDRQRVKIEVKVTPFRERPNLEIIIQDANGRLAASTSVIAIMHFQNAFTLHLRSGDDPAGNYTTRVVLYYDDIQSPQDTRDTALAIPAGS